MALAPRPYTVSASYARKRTLIATGLAVLGTVLLAGTGWFVSYESKKIHADQVLWATGIYADESHVSGNETSHSFILNDYSIDTTYTDTEGHAHSGRTEFELLFRSISDGERVDVKYDPQHPDRHVTSWAVDHVGARWGFVAFMATVFGLLFAGGSFAGARQQMRLLADARRVASRSDEVALELLSTKPVTNRGRHIGTLYVYKQLVRGQPQERKQQLPPKDVPMFTDEARTHLVALVSPEAPERPWIMRENKAPFENA